MRHVKLIALLILVCVPLILVAAGCGSSTASTAITVPTGWTTFESDSISLALPDSFQGGIPADSDRAAFAALAAKSGTGLHAGTPELEASVSTGLQLLMFGGLDAEGETPQVVVIRQPLVSLENSFKNYINGLVSGGAKIESISGDRASLVRTGPAGDGSDLTIRQYIVAKKTQDYAYLVYYSAPETYYSTMEPIFRTSAETIVVKEQQ